jgi:hypothetical protein
MAVSPMGKGTRGYPTLLSKGKGIDFYPRVRYEYKILPAGKGKGIKLYPWVTQRVPALKKP